MFYLISEGVLNKWVIHLIGPQAHVCQLLCVLKLTNLSVSANTALPLSLAPLDVDQALGQHLEDQDVEAFTKEVKDYDAVNRLDQWYTTILLRIKKQIPDGDELC